MQSSDRVRFVEIIVGFAELKGRQLSAPAIELFWNAMQHWDFAEFQAAANALIRSCAFMPTPKDFEDLRRAHKPTAGEAWARVLEHLKGGYRTGGLDPDTDRAVGAIGGYRALAMQPADQLHWDSKRFATVYGELEVAAEARAVLPSNVAALLGRIALG